MKTDDILINFDPYYRRILLEEKKSIIPSVLKGILKQKRKNFISLKELQKELEVEDHEMEEIVSDMMRKNRVNQHYIFTEKDGDICVGIARTKRMAAVKMSTAPDTEEDIVETKKEKPKIDEARRFELKRIFNSDGWYGLMAQPEFPQDDNWKTKTADEVIEEMATIVSE